MLRSHRVATAVPMRFAPGIGVSVFACSLLLVAGCGDQLPGDAASSTSSTPTASPASKAPAPAPDSSDPPAPQEDATTDAPGEEPQGEIVPDASWDDPFPVSVGTETVASGAAVEVIGEESFLSYQGGEEGLSLTLRDAYFGRECTHERSYPSERGDYLFLDLSMSLSAGVPEGMTWGFSPDAWRHSRS